MPAASEAAVGIVAVELERMRLLMAEMLVRCLQQHLISEEDFVKRADALDAPGGPEKSARSSMPPPGGLLPR